MTTAKRSSLKRTEPKALIRIDLETRRRLKVAAAGAGISMQEMARRAIRSGLNGNTHAAKTA